jgi:hypothetical protein
MAAVFPQIHALDGAVVHGCRICRQYYPGNEEKIIFSDPCPACVILCFGGIGPGACRILFGIQNPVFLCLLKQGDSGRMD